LETSPTGSKRLAEVVVLISILAYALFLRLQGLDDLGLWIDEDLTWIASHSIVRDGAPVLPSGEVYARGLTYSYVVGAFLSWFGSSLTVLRLPSVIFSLIGIVSVYFLARRMGGPLAAILATAILAVSPWDFHYAQMARMYGLFGLLFTAGVLWVYRGSFQGHWPSRVLALVAGAVLVPTHQLGIAMAWVYLVPFFFVDRRRSWLFAMAGIATLGVSSWAYRAIKASLRASHQTDLKSVLSFSSETKTFDLPLIPSSVTLNHASWIVRDFWNESTVIAAVISVLLIAIAVLFLVRRLHDRQSPLAWLCSLAFVVLLLLNQLVLATLAGFFLLSAARHSDPAPTTQRSFCCGLGRLIFDMGAALVLVTGVLLLGKLLLAGTEGLLERKFLRLFFSLPVPFYRLLVFQFPGMAAVVFLGGAVTFVRGLRPDADAMRSYVFLTFISLLVLMGMFSSPYVLNRYNFYLNGLFVALFAVLLTDGIRLVVGQLSRRPQRSGEDSIVRHPIEARETARPFYLQRGNLVSAAVLVIAILLLCEQFDPGQTWAATQRGYGYNRDTLQDPDLVSHFRYDFGGAARFVEENRREGDVVAAKEPVELFPYGLRCDYRVNEVYGVYATNGDGEIVDWYVDTPFLTTLAGLRAKIETTRSLGHQFWVVYPRNVEGGPQVHLPQEIKDYLADQPAMFTGRDGVTTVLRFD